LNLKIIKKRIKKKFQQIMKKFLK